MKKLLLLFGFMTLLTLAPAGIAWAQSKTASAGAAKPKMDIPPGFEPVKGAPSTENVDASKLVIGAYAAFFLGIFGYVIFLSREQAAIAKEMAELADQVRRAEKDA